MSLRRADHTRHTILEAAVRSLIAGGVAGTTTLEVQKRAKVSRGALLHHFPSKAQLMVATIVHLAELRGRELKARAAKLPPGEERLGAVIDLMWQSFTGPLFYVAMELRAAARTDRELRAALRRAERTVHARIVAQFRGLLGELADRPSFVPAFELTLQLMSGAAMTALLHGKSARVDPLIAIWKTQFPTLLLGGSS